MSELMLKDAHCPNEAYSPEFVHQIEFSELDIHEIVGRGAFGTVQKAIWKENVVAIKTLDINSGVKEYQAEVEQLSGVRHKNIIRLFGTSINNLKVYIVMEYADCGSLYNLLHPPEEQEPLDYSLGHVMKWSLQCAEAIAYLHSLQPKVIHRDLKPPNMLLTELGMVIKICDFGTATKIHTEMTGNKGSAAWMAPEVFEGKKYSEKCDVYSFGIVLWEMLSRKKPFDEIGPPAFRILWAVYNGTRPPPLQGISECLSKLMENCWAKDQSKRPSFTEILNFFKIAEQLVDGGDTPIFCYDTGDDYNEDADSVRETEYIPVEFLPPVNKYPPSTEYSHDPPPYLHNSMKAFDQLPGLPQPALHYSNADYSSDYSGLSPHSFRSGSSNRTTPQSVTKRSPIYDDNDPGFAVDFISSPNIDFGIIPSNLMPISPIHQHQTSIQMYNNYMEALKKYRDVQVRIKSLQETKKLLESNIEDVTKEKLLKLQNEKLTLLKHHRNIKSTLEKEKARRALNRSVSHTP